MNLTHFFKGVFVDLTHFFKGVFLHSVLVNKSRHRKIIFLIPFSGSGHVDRFPGKAISKSGHDHHSGSPAAASSFFRPYSDVLPMFNRHSPPVRRQHYRHALSLYVFLGHRSFAGIRHPSSLDGLFMKQSESF